MLMSPRPGTGQRTGGVPCRADEKRGSRARSYRGLGFDDAAERFPLKLRWSERGHADLAQEFTRSDSDLKGVAIDQTDCRLVGHADSAVVDVADHATCFVNGGESARRVRGRSDKEAPVRVRRIGLAAARAVERVNVFVSIHPRHHDANGRALRRTQQVKRPSRKRKYLGAFQLRHCFKFRGLVGDLAVYRDDRS